MAIDLKGKVVLITGASSGFGQDAVRLFANEGASVVMAARRIFVDMLKEEFSTSNAGVLSILDPGMTEAGLTLKEGIFQSGAGEWKVYVAVCDVGAPAPVAEGQLTPQ